MYGQIFAFLVVVHTVAFACGQCYSGYGGYVGTPLFLNTRVCDSPVVFTPVVAAKVCASPINFREAVGCPEVVSSCENSYGPSVVASPVIATGITTFGSTFGECAAC